MRARNRWGWGFEDAAFSTDDARAAAPGLVAMLGFGETAPEEPGAPAAGELPTPGVVDTGADARPAPEAADPAPPRVACPPHLRGICADDDATRIAHAHG